MQPLTMMSDFIRVSAIKDKLTECPVCMNEFNEKDRLPRRMPCCVHSICHLCLQNLMRRNQLTCPICRHEHNLPDGVASLPTETLMLKILDHLKFQKGLCLPCTDCPDGNEAISRCDDCCVFLCEECHRAHARHSYSRDHKTINFDEMKGRTVESFRKLHKCKKHQLEQQFFCKTCRVVMCVSCTVVDHQKAENHEVVSIDIAHEEKSRFTNDILSKLDEKEKTLGNTVKDLQRKKDTLHKSRKMATDDVNKTFDKLIELLQTRRDTLLSDIDTKSEADMKLTDEALDSTTTLLTKVKSSTEYTRQMRGRADMVEDLQLMVSSTDTLNTMLKETPQDVTFDRTGVTFVPAQVTQLKALLDVLGAVRTVTFTPKEKPPDVSADRFYIAMTPTELPQVPEFEQKFSTGEGTQFVCPHYEFDYNTANPSVQISLGVVSNTKPDTAPEDTGCRLKSQRRVLTTRPVTMNRGQIVVFCTRVEFTVKQVTDESKMIWETTLTSTPVDSKYNQSTGLCVMVMACPTHKQQLCLLVRYDGKVINHMTLDKNQVDVSIDLQLCVMVNRERNKVYIVDVNDIKVISTVSDVVNRPLWILMYVDLPPKSSMKSELISGSNVTLTQEMKQLLSSLITD